MKRKNMAPKIKKRIQLFAKIFVSLALILLLLQYIDFSATAKAISQVSIPLFTVAAIILVASTFFNSLTWRFLLPEKSIGLLTKLIFIARFYSTILPGQVLGEASKVVFIKKYDNNLHRITASIIVDKVLGFIAIFIIAIIGLIFENIGNIALSVIFSVIVAILIACLLLLRNIKVYQFFINSINKISNKLKFMAKLIQLVENLREYSQNSKALTLNLLFSIIFQFMGVLQYYVLCQALNVSISFMALTWIYAVVSVALFVPISIAGLGVRDITLVGLLAYYGVQGDNALALSMLILILTIALSLVGGILSFKTVMANKKDKADPHSEKS